MLSYNKHRLYSIVQPLHLLINSLNRNKTINKHYIPQTRMIYFKRKKKKMIVRNLMKDVRARQVTPHHYSAG